MDNALISILVSAIIALVLGILTLIIKIEMEDRKKREIGGILIAVAMTMIICIFIFWSHINTLNAQLKLYEQSKGWHLPETIESLGEAIKSFNLSVEERQLFEEQKADLEEETNKVIELEDQNIQLQERISDLEEQILFSQTEIVLTEGHTETLIQNSVYLGLLSVYDTYVYAQVDKNQKFINVGETIDINREGFNCDLVLMSIEEEAANFQFTCK